MNDQDLRDEVVAAALWVKGIDVEFEDCDVCEDGSVYHGLTQILPRGSVYPEQLLQPV